MLPSAKTQGLSGKQYILADGRGLAKDVVVRLSLEHRERDRQLGIEILGFQPSFGARRAKLAAVVDDIPTSPRRSVSLHGWVDELRDQGDQCSADIAHRHEECRARHIRVPQVVSAVWRNATRNT